MEFTLASAINVPPSFTITPLKTEFNVPASGFSRRIDFFPPASVSVNRLQSPIQHQQQQQIPGHVWLHQQAQNASLAPSDIIVINNDAGPSGVLIKNELEGSDESDTVEVAESAVKESDEDELSKRKKSKKQLVSDSVNNNGRSIVKTDGNLKWAENHDDPVSAAAAAAGLVLGAVHQGPNKKKNPKKKGNNSMNGSLGSPGGSSMFGVRNMNLKSTDPDSMIPNCTVAHCPLCKMPFHNREELIVHMQVHLQNERLNSYSECPVCKCIVKNPDLLEHTLGHATEVSVCSACNASFISMQELRAHFEIHRDHLLHQVSTCETCGEKFTDMQVYNQHLQKHMVEKLYDFGAMDHPEKPKGDKSGVRFECNICGNSFAWRKGLKRHIVSVHAKIKEHECQMCGKKFSRPEHLKRHLLRHTGEKPFCCETCGKSFIDMYSLRQHCRQHMRQHSSIGSLPGTSGESPGNAM